MVSPASLQSESRQRTAPPLSGNERGELEMYREWCAKVAAVCERAAQGDLEARLLGCDVDGDVGAMVRGINGMLDITDAFVREAKAALDYASRGEFFRRVLLRGLPGTFRLAAELINRAMARMQTQDEAIKLVEQRRLQLADEFDVTIQTVVASVASSASWMRSPVPSRPAPSSSSRQPMKLAAT